MAETKTKRPYLKAGHVAWTEIIIKDSDGIFVRLIWDDNGLHSIPKGYEEGEIFGPLPVETEIAITNPNGKILRIFDREKI